MATVAEMKQALINAHKAGDTAAATKIAGMIKQQMAVTPRSQAEIDKEYNAMPWYQQAATAADDLVRIGASGISFGGLDKLLGPEAEKATEEARMRAGFAAVPAEVLGAVASPVTRAVGGVGNAVAKTAPGLLARIGIGAGEGATLAAADAAIKGKDISDSASTGAIISGAIPIVGKGLARTSSFLQGTKPGAIETAYSAGKTGGTVSKSFRQGQRGEHIKDAQQEFAKAEKSWNNNYVNPKALRDEFAAIRKEVVTPTSVSKLTAEDRTAFDRMNSIIAKGLKRGSNVQNLDAIRRQIDAWADGTDMQRMMATRLKEAIRKSVNKVEPNYVPTLDKFSKAKEAQAAGKELDSLFPKSGLLGHLAQTAVIGSGLAGASIISPKLGLVAPAFMPKVSGLIANILGGTAGKLGPGMNPGTAAPVWSNYQDERVKDRKRRKRTEIAIPGGDLPVGN